MGHMAPFVILEALEGLLIFSLNLRIKYFKTWEETLCNLFWKAHLWNWLCHHYWQSSWCRLWLFWRWVFVNRLDYFLAFSIRRDVLICHNIFKNAVLFIYCDLWGYIRFFLFEFFFHKLCYLHILFFLSLFKLLQKVIVWIHSFWALLQK